MDVTGALLTLDIGSCLNVRDVAPFTKQFNDSWCLPAEAIVLQQ